MKFFKFALSLLLVGCMTAPAWGLTDREIEQDLNLLGETALAYNMALRVATAENTYTGWKRVITEYPHQDQTHHHAYLNAWQAAVRENNKAVYTDFMTLRLNSSLNAWAIHQIYQLVKAQNSVGAHVRFVEQYPDSVEAVAAWQQIQTLAFAKVQQQNSVSAYEGFIQAFLQAEYTDPQLLEKAMQAALAAEKARIITEYLDGNTERTHNNWQQRERAARELYNTARHSNTSELVAMLNMRLLDSELFIDTKVVTEKFDREELIAHQRRLEAKLDAVKQSVDEMHQGLLQGLREHTQVLQQETQKLQDTIASYDKWMYVQQAQLAAQIALNSANLLGQAFASSSESLVADIVADILPPVPFVPPVLVKVAIIPVIHSVKMVGGYLKNQLFN